MITAELTMKTPVFFQAIRARLFETANGTVLDYRRLGAFRTREREAFISANFSDLPNLTY